MPELNGDRVRLARIAYGLTQKDLAEKVAANATTISKIERGELQPSDLLVRAISEALQFEPEYLAREVPDPFRVEECSFRHLQSASKAAIEQALAKGTNIQELATSLEQYATFPEPNLPSIPVPKSDKIDRTRIEQAAEECRRAWGLDPDSPISNVVRLAELAGVLVVRIPGDDRRVDAFSRFGSLPLIVLTSIRRQAAEERFFVAHELGHLVIHRDREVGDFKSEREANYFAAALLMPRNGFSVDFNAIGRRTWPHIFELKRKWKVLTSAIIYRADDLGLMSPIETRRLYKQHSARGWKKGEPQDVPSETGELLALAAEVAERDFGVGLLDLVRSLGYRKQSAKAVLGIDLPDEEQPLPRNVTRIDRFREK